MRREPQVEAFGLPEQRQQGLATQGMEPLSLAVQPLQETLLVLVVL
jgi:hypothetical protein